MNAAVEAARAGEAGLGFAVVVANEVSNLAQRCAQAAKDTATLIEESVANARTGSARLDDVAAVIGSITESAAKVKILVDEVSVGAGEQSRSFDAAPDNQISGAEAPRGVESRRCPGCRRSLGVPTRRIRVPRILIPKGVRGGGLFLRHRVLRQPLPNR